MKTKTNEEKRNTAGVRRRTLFEKTKPFIPKVIGVLTGAAIAISTTILPVFAIVHSDILMNRNAHATTEVNAMAEMLLDDYNELVDEYHDLIITLNSVNGTGITAGTITDTTTTTSNSSTTTSQEMTTISSEKTQTVVTSNEVTMSTTVTSTNTTATTTTSPREYIVYKPSTHYIHMNTCRWFDSTCQEITDTNGIECRRCSECHPDIEIINEYTTTTTTTTVTEPETVETIPVEATESVEDETTASENNSEEDTGINTELEHYALNFITEEERIYLCNVVGTEYGANWVSTYDKALVVATIMNRVRDGGWSGGRENTIYNVITAPGQYNPAYAVPYYRNNVTQSCIDAVDYYFMHRSEFPNVHSFWGDGHQNHFS